MNKKYKLIIAIASVLILIIAGCIYYIKTEESKMGFVSFDSFKRQEIDGKIVMENKEVGLSFEVPNGWEIRNDALASVSMASVDFEPLKSNTSTSIPEKGCWIGVTARIEKEGTEYDLYYSDIKNLISDKEHLAEMNTEDHKYEIINILGYDAVKESMIVTNTNSGAFILIQIPVNNKIYFFETDLFGQDKDNKCPEEFDNFLKTLSIKN